MSAILWLSIATLLIALIATASAITLVRQPLGADGSGVSEESIRRARRVTMVLGLVELSALIALIAAFFAQPAGSRHAWLIAVAFICVLTMGGVWLMWIVPVNAALASAASSELHAERSQHETRRTIFHALRLALAILALALLVMAVFAKPLQ